MPNLHELFDAATGDLPPLPDLAPSARKIARRRQLAARTTAAMLSSALVIGAGTFALAIQHSGSARDAASSPPLPYSQQHVLDTLRSLWPNKNQQFTAEGGSSPVIVISQDGKQIGFLSFEVLADVAKFPEELNCIGHAPGCLKATTTDGDKVLAEAISGQSIRVASTVVKTFPPASQSYSQSSADGSPTAHPGSGPGSTALTSNPPGVGITRGYRLHGTYFGQLDIYGTSPTDTRPLTNQQMLSLVESPAYGQLIESAVAASSLNWFGTPPAGLPSNTTTYAPSPSLSAGETPAKTTTPPTTPLTTPAN